MSRVTSSALPWVDLVYTFVLVSLVIGSPLTVGGPLTLCSPFLCIPDMQPIPTYQSRGEAGNGDSAFGPSRLSLSQEPTAPMRGLSRI